VKTDIIQIVVGALGTIPKSLKKPEDTTVIIELLQKAALLGEHEYTERY